MCTVKSCFAYTYGKEKCQDDTPKSGKEKKRN